MPSACESRPCGFLGAALIAALLAACISPSMAVRNGPGEPHSNRASGEAETLANGVAHITGPTRNLNQAASTTAGIVGAGVTVASFANQVIGQSQPGRIEPQIHPVNSPFQCLNGQRWDRLQIKLDCPSSFWDFGTDYVVGTNYCEDDSSEYWRITDGNDFIKHSFFGSDHCLTASSGGDHVCGVDCGDAKSDPLQYWQIQFLECDGSGRNRVASSDSGDVCVRCLDYEWVIKVIRRECVEKGEGVFMIKSLSRDGKCLSFNGDGEKVTLADCDEYDMRQLWYVPGTPDF